MLPLIVLVIGHWISLQKTSPFSRIGRTAFPSQALQVSPALVVGVGPVASADIPLRAPLDRVVLQALQADQALQVLPVLVVRVVPVASADLPLQAPLPPIVLQASQSEQVLQVLPAQVLRVSQVVSADPVSQAPCALVALQAFQAADQDLRLPREGLPLFSPGDF